MSARGLAGPVTGQGGGGAALASALNLDRGLYTYFRGSKDEECYGEVRLQPLTYVDDILRGTTDINSLRAGNVKLNSVLIEKQLEAHPTKSCYLVYGSESFKAKCDLDSSDKPIMLGEIVLKEKKSEAYLGEGLTASVQATIKGRTSKVKGSIYELRSLIKDF